MNRDQAVVYALLRNDFLSFLRRCLATLNPHSPFFPNWHIEAIAYQLERVMAGEVTRLIINMPPRYLKSLTVSVAFPAFLLGHDPSRRIIGISYGTELSAKHAADFRSVVQSQWYRSAFPDMKVARSLEMDVHTTRRGFRKATSVYAALTGLGGNCFIIDDPQKPIDAMSETQRNQLKQWFSNTLMSRLDNEKTDPIILVMQRVHLEDLTGYLLESAGDWTVLNLPAIAEVEEKIPIGPGRFHIRLPGEALQPERETLDTLRKLQREMGSEVFAAQYQQAPVPPGGGVIKRKWIGRYDRAPERNWQSRVIQSWDTASKDGATNDWSVCTTWLVRDKCFYLLHVLRERYDYPTLRAKALEHAALYGVHKVLIEDTGVGTALIQELGKTGKFSVIPVKPERDKLTRASIQSAKFESGMVLFPRDAPWLPELEAELFAFPQSRHDDQVDSITQALAHATSGYDSTLAWVGV